MALQIISLTVDEVNASLQVGDSIYYSIPNIVSGGFDNANLGNTIFLGEVQMILSNTTIAVQYDDAFTSPPSVGYFISFSKNKAVNRSSLKGYYADVKIVNNSNEKAELFSLGSEVSESSK